MTFRLGLVLGLAAGYVLGAKAGRVRYEQIARAWGSVRRSEPAQQLGAEAREAATKAGQTLGEKANEGVAKVTDLVRGAQDEQSEPTPTPYAAPPQAMG